MKNKRIFIALILSILTAFSLTVELAYPSYEFVRNNTGVLTACLIAVSVFFLYKKYLFKVNSQFLLSLLAFIFSIFMVLFHSYDVVGDSSLVFGNILFFIIALARLVSYFVFFNLGINLLYGYLVTKRDFKNYFPKITKYLDKHPFLFSFLFIFICYLPYIICFYPVILNYDGGYQIREMLGLHTFYLDSVILLDESVTLTNFNPLIHTFLLGGLFKFGYTLGNQNFGLFLYTIIQLSIVISVFAYTIVYLKKAKVHDNFVIGALLIYALIPVFPFYAMTAVKDVIFSSLIVLYVIKLYNLLKNEQTIKDYIILGLIILLVTLFRNNGIYTIVLSFPALFFILSKSRKPLIIVFFVNVLFYIAYNNVLLPYFKIPNTSIRETLSIPFQQTARYVKYHGDDVTEEERKIIDHILEYDTLAENYQPDLSDPVKNKYNKYTTREELKQYFKVWFKMFFRHPSAYFDATISNVYGYFYPNTSRWYIYYRMNPNMVKDGFDYHYIDSLEFGRNILIGIGEAFPYVPIVGLIVNIGVIVWIYLLILVILIVNKNSKYITVILPALSIILACVAGPVNTYFRYILPILFALPPTVSLLYFELKQRV